MASLVLIISELLRPKSAQLLVADYSTTARSSSAAIAAAAASLGKGRSVGSKTMKSSESEDVDALENLTEMKISVEAIWP
ncbi:hypothetical protein COCNU_scaffold001466G000060 [Cocos nucifera]|nr:hypothetical protein [Cocos nucifera]